MSFYCLSSHAQSQNSYSFSPDVVEEELFIHHNSSYLVPGEKLYYSIYNRLSNSNEFSEISKYAYVELRDESNDVVFSHKLKLDKLGKAYSDYLIPASLKTGIYYLIGYTKWMLNYNKTVQSEILITNPFLPLNSEKVSFSSNDVSFNNAFSSKAEGNEIDLNKKVFQKREKVQFSLPQNIGENPQLSISVKKVDSAYSSIATNLKSNLINKNSSFQLKFLPEIRGENISVQMQDSLDRPLKQKQSIAYSVPNKVEDFRIFKSDENGQFQIQLDKRIDYSKAYLNVLENTGNATFKLKPFDANIQLENEKNFVIPAVEKENIRDRAIYSQIEQNYKELKSDSIVTEDSSSAFYGDKFISFNLDNYTRFKTMKETFIEIVEFAYFNKDKNGNHQLFIRGVNEADIDRNNKPLILVDGLYVTDADYLYNYDPLNVEKIDIIRDTYYYGPETFRGLVIISTAKPELSEMVLGENPVSIKPTESPKRYFNPEEEYLSHSNYPDYRYQLYWSPTIEEDTIEFYTSDISGIFEISIQGFTASGEPVSLKQQFKVN